MGVTLLDVARAAGVSRTTASNAFNDPTQLSRSLRQKVLQTAQSLGYMGPSPVARAMRRGRTMMVGLVFEEALGFVLEDPYARGLLGGLSESLTKAHHSLALIPVDRSGAGLENIQVDGIVGYRLPPDHPAFRLARQRGWKVVQTAALLPGEDGSYAVTIDEAGGAEMALQHLVDFGHRRVHVMVDVEADGLDDLAFPYHEQRERWRGFAEVAGPSGVELVAVAAGRNVRENGFVAMREILAHGDVSAVAAMTDVLALGALDAATSAGLTVGRDVSIVGFDDVPEAGEAGLTTVGQPIRERGIEVGRLLVEEDVPRVVTLPCHLIVRQSTGSRVGGADPHRITSSHSVSHREAPCIAR